MPCPRRQRRGNVDRDRVFPFAGALFAFSGLWIAIDDEDNMYRHAHDSVAACGCRGIEYRESVVGLEALAPTQRVSVQVETLNGSRRARRVQILHGVVLPATT